MRLWFLPPGEVGLLLGMLVPSLGLLALGEVAASLIVHTRVAGLLPFGEVAAMLLLERLALFLLAFREATGVLGPFLALILIVRMIGIVIMAVIGGMDVRWIVVGMLAHVLWVSQRIVWLHCGTVVKPSTGIGLSAPPASAARDEPRPGRRA